jgi:hypothetical protein
MTITATARLRAGQAVTENDVRELLRRMVEQDYPSLRAAARQWKCSAAMVSDVLRGNRHPGPTLLRVVGLRRVVTVEYRRQDDTGKPGNAHPVKRRTGARQ